VGSRAVAGVSPREIFRLIVLPQCLRRMLPPWMNLYASITMSTSLASLVGVHDVVDTAQIASNTVARTDFTILVYFTLLACSSPTATRSPAPPAHWSAVMNATETTA
jgi:polar amino acid transport system permease protein